MTIKQTTIFTFNVPKSGHVTQRTRSENILDRTGVKYVRVHTHVCVKKKKKN